MLPALQNNRHVVKIWQHVCVWPLCDGCWSIFLHSPSGCSASSQRRWECVCKALDCWINWRKWKSCFGQSGWKLGSPGSVCFPQILPLLFLYLGFWMVLSSHCTLQIEWRCDREESDPECLFFLYKHTYKKFLQGGVLCIHSVTQMYCIRPLRNMSS